MTKLDISLDPTPPPVPESPGRRGAGEAWANKAVTGDPLTNQTPRIGLPCSILAALDRIGERALMDFGFGAILDRIERDFGAKWAKFLTVLSAIGIAAGCFTLVGNLISSAALWLDGVTSGVTLWDKFVLLSKYLLGFGLVIVLGRNLATVATVRGYTQTIQHQVHQSDALLAQADDVRSGYEENMDEFRRLILKAADVSPNEEVAREFRLLEGKIRAGRRNGPTDQSS